jgi:hypothetical protein
MYVPQGSGFRCQGSVLRQTQRDVDPKPPNSCLLHENFLNPKTLTYSETLVLIHGQAEVSET